MKGYKPGFFSNQSSRLLFGGLFIGMLLLVVSCGQQQSANTVEFRVDKGVLSESPFLTEDGALRLNPPAGWDLLDSSSPVFESIAAALRGPLLAVYMDGAASLVISELTGEELQSLDQIVENPSYYYNQDNRWLAIQHAPFTYNDYQVDQLVFQSNELVMFKLFARRMGRVFEINYSLSRDRIEQYSKIVESSIGSMF